MSFWIVARRTTAVVFSLWACVTLPAVLPPAGAQTPSARRFLTVTVKESESGGIQTEPRAAGGKFSWPGVPLIRLVAYAYDKQLQAIEGTIPVVIDDMEATYAPTATPGEVREMARSLLRDRFAFRAHMQTRQAPVFDLVVDGGRHRLTPAQTAGPSAAPGIVRVEAASDRTSFIGRGVTLRQIANGLADIVVKRPVIDRTGIAGVFDIDVTYARGGERLPAPGLLPIAAALGRQSGLQLNERSGSVEFLVVDRIEALK